MRTYVWDEACYFSQLEVDSYMPYTQLSITPDAAVSKWSGLSNVRINK